MIADNLYTYFSSYTNIISEPLERIFMSSFIYLFITKGESIFFQIMLISCERSPHLLVELTKTIYQVIVSTFEVIFVTI